MGSGRSPKNVEVGNKQQKNGSIQKNLVTGKERLSNAKVLPKMNSSTKTPTALKNSGSRN